MFYMDLIVWSGSKVKIKKEITEASYIQALLFWRHIYHSVRVWFYLYINARMDLFTFYEVLLLSSSLQNITYIYSFMKH